MKMSSMKNFSRFLRKPAIETPVPPSPVVEAPVEDLIGAGLRAEIDAATKNQDISIDVFDEKISVNNGNRRIIISRKHEIYLRDIWTQFDYYFETVEPVMIGDISSVDYSVPAWHVIRETGKQLYFSSFAEDIGATRLYEYWAYPRPGDVVFDIGAYCGLSVIMFSRAVGSEGRVVAFEPDPKNCSVLRQNVAHSGVSNVSIHQMAVFGESRKLHFSSEGNMGSAVLQEASQNRGDLIEVDGITLDEVAETHGFERVDILKFDIEGSEYSVIENSSRFLAKFKPRIIMELHADPWPDGPVHPDRIRRVLDEIGYYSSMISTSPAILSAVHVSLLADVPSRR